MTRRNRLENIFLLILRCLVVCLLALGFSRPFFQRPMIPDPPGTGQRIILLVDTSASMRRQNLWNLALAKATEILKTTAPADQVAIFTFDRQTHPVVTFDQWSSMNAGDRAALSAQQLAGKPPGWETTHLGDALIGAAELFSDADKQGRNAGRRRIVLITDLQEGSRLDGLQGYDWPRGIEVEIEAIKAARPTNAGLQWVVDAEDTPQSIPTPGARVRVVNASNSKREQFQIRWDGVSGTGPLDIYVPPGQSRIVSAPDLTTNVAPDRLLLTGDDDDFDNAIYLVPPKPRRATVLFLGDDAEKDPAQLLYYVERAFQQTHRQIVSVVVRSTKSPLAPADASGVTFVIVGGSLPREQLESVKKLLDGGMTILVVVRDRLEIEMLGELAGTPISGGEAPASGYAMFGHLDFEHPLFAPFADPRFSDFTKIHFWKHRRLETDKLPDAHVVARFDNGDAALLEVLKGKGRLLALASGWQPSDSQLALSSKFVPLLYSMLDLSGGVTTSLAQYHVGDEVDLAPLDSAQPVTVRRPDGSEVRLKAGETRFTPTDVPGIYTVSSQQPPSRFAINLDSAESRTAPMPVEEFMRLGVPMKTPEVEVAQQAAQKRRLHNAELEGQQKLWRWLIVAALVVLLMETCLAGWLTRRQATQAVI